MLRLLAPLVGFAVFGALFAGVLYDDPVTEQERRVHPKFRLAPGEIKSDFIEPAGDEENVTVNVTVLSGGPIDVYVMDIENVTLHVLNGTLYGFDPVPDAALYLRDLSASGVERWHNFTLRADGERQYGIVIVSKMAPPPDPANLSEEEAQRYVTEVAVLSRYIDRETRSLVWGYILAAPSVLLVGVTLWLKLRRPASPEAPPPAPRDDGL